VIKLKNFKFKNWIIDLNKLNIKYNYTYNLLKKKKETKEEKGDKTEEL